MKRAGSKFSLEDLSGMISGETTKQEKATSSASKSKIPIAKASRQVSKKKKGNEPSMFDDLPAKEVLKKLSEGLERVDAEFEKMEAEHMHTILDLRKLAQARMLSNTQMEGEILKLKAELAEIRTVADLKVEEAIDDAMKSASIAVLQSKIKMVEEASADGFSVAMWTKDLEKWKDSLANLQDVSMVVAEEEAGMGDDGKNAKA